MNLINLVRTASQEANALTSVAAVALLIKILWLNRFPGRFFGAHELGLIVEAILASVVASYIFYLLVVHVKEYSEREILRPYVEKHSRRLVGDCMSQVMEIAKASSMNLEVATISMSDISSAFSKISPNSDAPLIMSVQTMKHANWFQYFDHHKTRSTESIRKLLDQLPFLDANLVGIVTAIDDCMHFTQLKILTTSKVSNETLSVWSKSFYDYCMLCKRLDAHLVRLGFTSAIPK